MNYNVLFEMSFNKMANISIELNNILLNIFCS